MSKAIITGGTGFIGCALCERLLKHGYEVISIQRTKSHNHFNKCSQYREIICDLANIDNLHIENTSGALFFHFAWPNVSGVNNEKEVYGQISGITYSLKCIQLANRINCSKFIFAGSIFEYVNFINSEISYEKNNLRNVYSYAKNMADNLCNTLATKYNITYISCILSNVYGPGKTDRFVNNLIRKMLRNESFKLSQCNQMYDFMFIDDAITAILLCAEKGSGSPHYYIGDGNIKPLHDYISIIQQIVNPNYTLQFSQLNSSSTYYSYEQFNITRVKDEFGFISRTSFHKGIENTMKYIEEVISNESTRR